jgi:hypothetical protein
MDPFLLYWDLISQFEIQLSAAIKNFSQWNDDEGYPKFIDP